MSDQSADPAYTGELTQAEWRERLLAGQERARREREVRVVHAEKLMQGGKPHESLRRVVAVRGAQADRMVAALGDAVTPQKRALVEQWLQSTIIADSCFAIFARDGQLGRAVERHSTAVNTARAALVALGLDGPEVISIAAEYDRAIEAAQERQRAAEREHAGLDGGGDDRAAAGDVDARKAEKCR